MEFISHSELTLPKSAHAILIGLAELTASDGFARQARHPSFPNAFTRARQLPLPALIALLLSMRAGSQQAMLDEFFGAACGVVEWVREVSDRAFAKASSHLYIPAFKRLKHRKHLECVCGLSQQALIIDVAAKVLADNIAALICATAAADANCALRERRCNRSYAAKALHRMLTPVPLFIVDVIGLIDDALRLLAANTQRYRPDQSRPRQPNSTKPHPSVAYKG